MRERTPAAGVEIETSGPLTIEELSSVVADVVATTPFVDVHTHLFPPEFGTLGLWGIDHLLTYHYLEAELFRTGAIRPEVYWALGIAERADRIWKTLFVERTPISEATRGVIAVLQSLGLDASVATLEPLRQFFSRQVVSEYIPRVLRLAGISDVVMTNDPLDREEWPCWERGARAMSGFHAALRLDQILNDWSTACGEIARRGYDVDAGAGGRSLTELRRFLADVVLRMSPIYMAVSLPDSFDYPTADVRTRLLDAAVLPACRDADIPLALMIGVRRQVNPSIRLAGDAGGRADLRSLERLLAASPDNRFLVTVLSRENQHELCIYARKFSRLMPFGCWWFLNNPSIVEEITRERLEMLGVTFIPQHSDARVLEQVIYKWRNTRRTLAPILTNAYQRLLEDGRPVTRTDVQRDVTRLFRTNVEEFTPISVR